MYLWINISFYFKIMVLKNIDILNSPEFNQNVKIWKKRSVQSLSSVRLFVTPWSAAHQASLSITNSWNLPKMMSIESLMPSNHLTLCHHLLIPPSIFPSIRMFSNEPVLCISWPKYLSFSFSTVLQMNIQNWFPLGWIGWISLLSKRLSRVCSGTTVWLDGHLLAM